VRRLPSRRTVDLNTRMPLASSISIVTEHARTALPLHSAALSEEYFYQSLPLCVLDAVFSIGVRYDSTRQVVIRYCNHTSQRRIRPSVEAPPVEAQESITGFCTRPEQADVDLMAELIYENRQRTSARGGILKADAALRFAQALRSFGVEHFQDIPRVADSYAFDAAVRSIPGQGSGISLQYFWMLSGADAFVKPDRMVVRFLESALSRPVDLAEAVDLVREASRQLNNDFPKMSPRLLDHEIWKYQRSRAEASPTEIFRGV
jgi:hypothetical protein